MSGHDDEQPIQIDDNDFVTTPPPRRWWRKKRLLWPLGALVAVVLIFLALRTPDTDHDAMIAKYGNSGGMTTFARGPAGQSIHYRDQGCRTCPAMVLLHGSNASLHTWEPLVARLGKQYRIVTLDLPGHGLTGSTPDGDYSPGGMMAAVDVVAAELELDRFILGGNSMGGAVSWRYALAQPARVEALLLLNASGMPPRNGEKAPASNIGFRIMRYSVGRWLAGQITPRSLVKSSLEQSVSNRAIVTDAAVDRYWELLRFPGNRQATAKRATLPRDAAMADRISEITAPTFVLFGAEDRIINPSAAQSFGERIAGSKVVLLPGIGHLPMEEAPDETATAIAAFLAQRRTEPPLLPVTPRPDTP
ncbi:MAG: alpha/beta fold hydrolase [Sphingopyxis sp.]|nr:alpha/beta fold hydrolase [Sphingopyxis sp.]